MAKLKSDSAKPASPKVDVIMGDVIGELPKVPKEDDDKVSTERHQLTFHVEQLRFEGWL